MGEVRLDAVMQGVGERCSSREGRRRRAGSDSRATTTRTGQEENEEFR